ncbi:MAG TPA: 2-dehydropantoate 2-reductase [Ramlibacter sp.]|uniref:2-dehydropantoate 2-reductase n=1 Tax=Ramlibacter sp. TaxID=1917967 RepID=UPI002CD07A35|nr:2-dehydropantoate 2-reductase [Ramlibacter sp.]HVZ44738.1 2-dehydropantoate 2-reductase [Ramlibacter sp.]
MKIAIVGAGAIGGLVGARLALAGEDVTLVVRGQTLAAIRAHGLKLIEQDGTAREIRNVRATDDYAAAGAQDLVIVAVKAHQLEAVAHRLPALLGADTPVVTMQNGIPFWYFHKHGGPLEGRQVLSVDAPVPIAHSIAPDRVIGCVVYPAAEVVSPGVIRHVEGDRFPVGELDGRVTARVESVSQCFQRAGFKSPVLADIRAEIWLKLWGNLSFNPISGLSHATLADICGFALTRELAANMMREAQSVAERLGITLRVPLEKRLAGAEKVGHHKTSMLQDIEAGREPEVDALVGSVVELARISQTPTPHIDAVYALVKLLAHKMAGAGAQVRLQGVFPSR